MELYTIPIPSEPDRFILYRPLAGLALVGNRPLAEIIQGIANDGAEAMRGAPTEVLAFLEASGFLQPDPAPPQEPQAAFQPTIAVLLMTNRCQLRCTYCYASAGEAPPQELSFALAKTAIDTVFENARRTGAPYFEVSFHGGGEPTLAWKTLQACCAYARSLPWKSRLTLTSNGVWSPRQATWIVENLDGLTLSLDGRAQTQDRQRPFSDGRASFARVMRAVPELDRHHFDYAIRPTATTPWETLPDEVRFLCAETGCKTFQVEPAFNSGRGGHGQPDLQDGLAFARACLEAIDVATQAGRTLFFSGARLGTLTSAFCTAPYQALIVNANGDLVTCYEIADQDHRLAQLSTIGRIQAEQAVIDEAARLCLHSLMTERRRACRECFCYWSCAGNCYTRAFGSDEQGHLQQGVRCEINRTITLGLLLRGIARVPADSPVWRMPQAAYSVYQLAVSQKPAACEPPHP